MSTTKAPILLIGSYGRGNIGDDAFLLAALKLFAGHQLYINSTDDNLLPAAVKGKVNTIATATSSGLLEKIQVFLRIKYVVYCGGDLWVELYGDRYPRQSLYKMAIVNLLARLCGKKVMYVGCGIGKLSGYSLGLARFSARLANGIAVREQRSADVLDLPHVTVLPDLVSNVDITPGAPPLHRGGKDFVIGISLLWHLPDPEQNFPRLVKILTAVLHELPDDSTRVVLFPMLASPSDAHDDVWASEQLQAALPGKRVSIFAGREVAEYVAALQEVDVLIGARLHANIIALLAGVPSVGISYRPKVAQFFASAGLADYSIDLAELTPENLTHILRRIQTEPAATSAAFLEARSRIIQERTGYQDFIAKYF